MREADARIHSADAESKRSKRDLDRYVPLSKQGFASQQKFESAAAGSETAGAEAQRARAGFEIARAQALVTARRADEIAAQLADAQAQAARAAANLSLARQDLEHTIIRAPISGTIGDRHVEPGQYVQPGTRLMALVPPSSIYVVANFKETQTAHMRQGQEAVVELDALPGQKFAGTVDSLAPASGSEFALLPFEPGTGNFTKIVQRLAVRIKLPPETRLNPALRPGLSATIRVRLSPGT
jgi:membrane fusion protein (multidrug efflux system)